MGARLCSDHQGIAAGSKTFPINSSAIALTTILSYSAVAGFVGGALEISPYAMGNIAETDIMLVTVALLVVLVQVLQEAGMKLARMSDKRK